MLGTILIFSNRSRILVAAALVALVSSACVSEAESADGVTVVATTTIAGDLVARVVRDAASVEVLMPAGADPHDFSPSSQQVATLRTADLVVAWGLGLEEGMEDVLESAAGDGVRVLELSALVDPISFGEEDDEDENEEDHGHGGLDPHTWMDPVRMAAAVREIGLALTQIAPGGDWMSNAERASSEFLAVHDELVSILSVIPPERRKLVTNHDAFGYLADRYDFEVVGVAVPGGSTLASPSPAQIARLVDAVRDAGVDVLFAETTSSSGLLDAVAGELEGVRVVELLEGSLAPEGEVGDTLDGMLFFNARTIAEALGS
ncbi:MAG TPA: metal ABC transporter substrate-binding protein [Acidimicrobiia bacterium]|nr:metal ABC transporter substrate-binding protein [Acidimicrobiia bacterium]